MIYITEKAANKIKEIANEEGIPPIVRAKILGSGCAGFSSDLSFDEIMTELDDVIEFDGVKVVVDQVSAAYLNETVIDYAESEWSSGFTFNNPNTTGSCGCGKSVSF
jgi:iron-sulfur cluster insertion protein